MSIRFVPLRLSAVKPSALRPSSVAPIVFILIRGWFLRVYMNVRFFNIEFSIL